MLVADSPTNHPNAISGRSRSRVSTCQLMVMHSFFTLVIQNGHRHARQQQRSHFAGHERNSQALKNRIEQDDFRCRQSPPSPPLAKPTPAKVTVAHGAISIASYLSNA